MPSAFASSDQPHVPIDQHHGIHTSSRSGFHRHLRQSTLSTGFTFPSKTTHVLIETRGMNTNTLPSKLSVPSGKNEIIFQGTGSIAQQGSTEAITGYASRRRRDAACSVFSRSPAERKGFSGRINQGGHRVRQSNKADAGTSGEWTAKVRFDQMKMSSRRQWLWSFYFVSGSWGRMRFDTC